MPTIPTSPDETFMGWGVALQKEPAEIDQPRIAQHVFTYDRQTFRLPVSASSDEDDSHEAATRSINQSLLLLLNLILEIEVPHLLSENEKSNEDFDRSLLRSWLGDS
jgi:hypothetical protein